jgi:AcrR family transcriptional regulator
VSRKTPAKPESKGARELKTMRRSTRPRKTDERVLRTRERLGNAFLALILEKLVDDVTIEDVLRRASVGRSTFYLHFRDKNDLLLSQLERFLEHMSTVLSERKERSRRVTPVEEIFAHLGNRNPVYRTIAPFTDYRERCDR